MFQVTGLLQNCFKQDATDKYDESFKIQILGDHVQQNGELRQELLTLTVPRNVYREFESLKGRSVTLPVGLFVNGNRVQAFIPKGSNLTAPKASGGGLRSRQGLRRMAGCLRGRPPQGSLEAAYT